MTELRTGDIPMGGDKLVPKAIGLPRMQTYVLALVVGALVVVGSYTGMILTLDKLGRLPPPQLSNDLCVDEKLMSMRNQPPADAELLVIGSSVAFRHFDSALAAERGLKPYNGAFCGLKVNQNAEVTAWLLERLPSVKTLVLIASPIDYEECAASKSAPFSTADADSYIFGKTTSWTYYFRYFDPLALFRNSMTIKAQRAGIEAFNALALTPYGDGPANPPNSNGLLYGVGLPLDASCFRDLTAFATAQAESGRSLLVVNSPINPVWQDKYDADRAKAADLDARIVTALEGTGAKYWNAAVEFAPGTEGFYDSVHLKWPVAHLFTERLLDGPLAPLVAKTPL